MADLLSYTCPCCGGAIKFDNKVQKPKCQFCDTEFEVEDLKAFDESLKNDFKEETTWETNTSEMSDSEINAMNGFFCETCGGEVMTDSNTVSTACPFCGNPVMVTKRMSGVLKPNIIIPFKLEKDDAKNNLVTYYKGKLLLPSAFKTDNKIEEIKGLYVPYWIFDADVTGNVTYKAEKVRHWHDDNWNYTETSHYRIIRNGNIGFEHIPVDASKKMPDDLMESIEPFDFEGTKPFSQAYIAGYLADKYDVSKEETFKRATVRIKEGTADAFRASIHGYDSVSVDTTQVKFNSSKADYAFYPIWTLATKYKENNYQFAMNGQTGKMTGNLPVSPIKFTIAMLISFITFAVIFGIPSLFITKNDDGSFNPGVTILIALVAGIIAAAIIMFLLWRKMKPVRLQHGAANYVVKDSINYTLKRDLFLYKTRTRSPRSNPNNNNKR